MTPDQDAATRSVGERIAALYLPAEPQSVRRAALAEEITAALAQARAEEREACARLIEGSADLQDGDVAQLKIRAPMTKALAAAIRARPCRRRSEG